MRRYSVTFFWICAEEANKLQSVHKLDTAYNGLLVVADMLFFDKKYEESSKLSQQFLEMMQKRGIPQEALTDFVWRFARSLAKQGKGPEANKLIDNMVKAKESDWRRWEIKARLKLELNETDEARRIYEELSKAVNAPAVREKLVAQGIEVSGAPGDKLDDFVRKEMVRWAKVIKDNNIKSGD